MITIASLFAYHPLLELMQLEREAMRHADDYMGIVCMGTIFVFGYNSICAVLRGMGDSTHPLYFVLAATVINVALDLLLVGYLHMGSAGAAGATVASQGVSFLAAAAFLKRSGLAAGAYTAGLFVPHAAKLILKIGLPAAGQMAILNLSYLIATGMLNVFGVAVGQAVSTIAGQLMGAGNGKAKI